MTEWVIAALLAGIWLSLPREQRAELQALADEVKRLRAAVEDVRASTHDAAVTLQQMRLDNLPDYRPEDMP